MRIAVFSDVHGNIDALEAVLADAASCGVQEHWVAGDLVANGPAPAAVLTRLRSMSSTKIIRGNTDRYVLNSDPDRVLSQVSSPPTPSDMTAVVVISTAHAWTRGCLTAVPDGYSWLASLPTHLRMTLPDSTRVLLAHAAPDRDDGPGATAEMTDQELRDAGWDRAEADLIMVGHTHRPLDRRLGSTHIVNPGSVSLPATADHGASWLLLTATDAGYSVEQRSVPYDLEAVLRRVDFVHHPTPDWLKAKIIGRPSGG